MGLENNGGLETFPKTNNRLGGWNNGGGVKNDISVFFTMLLQYNGFNSMYQKLVNTFLSFYGFVNC